MDNIKDILSPLTGMVWSIDVEVGDQVEEDDPIVTIESMKMEIPIYALEDGKITEILVSKTDIVKEGQVLARMAV